jgi:hypothetical protein
MPATLLLLEELVGGGDVDGVADAAGDRAVVGVEAVHALDGVTVDIRVDGQLVADVDPLDDERLALQLDLAGDVAPETTASGRDPARLQRAPEGAGESTAGRGDHVVDGRRVGIVGVRGHAVVLGDGAVHPERHGVGRTRDARLPDGPAVAIDGHLGRVDDLTHVVPL